MPANSVDSLQLPTDLDPDLQTLLLKYLDFLPHLQDFPQINFRIMPFHSLRVAIETK